MAVRHYVNDFESSVLVQELALAIKRVGFLCSLGNQYEQNQQNDCAPSEDSDQPGHLHMAFFWFCHEMAQYEGGSFLAQQI